MFQSRLTGSLLHEKAENKSEQKLKTNKCKNVYHKH